MGVRLNSIFSASFILCSSLFGASNVDINTSSTIPAYTNSPTSYSFCVSKTNNSDLSKPFVDFNYSFDGTTWYDVASISVCPTFPSLSNGSKTLRVNAWTTDGNLSNLTNGPSFIVDTNIPGSPIAYTAEGNLSASPAGCTANICASGDVNISITPVSNTDVVYASYTLNSKIYSIDFNVSDTNITLPDLGSGTHTIYLYAKDLAGNKQTDTNRTTVTIYMDSTKPKISSLSYEAFTHNGDIELNVTTDENVSAYRYDINGTVITANTSLITVGSSVKSFNISNTRNANGEYNVTLAVQDIYGNWSEDKNITIKMDYPTSTVTLLGVKPEGNASVSSISLAPWGNRIAQYSYATQNGAASQKYNIGETNISLSSSFTNGQDYNLTVSYFDFGGNFVGTEGISWTQNTSSSNKITFSSLPSLVSNSNSGSITFTGVGGEAYDYYLDSAQQGSATTGTTFNISGLTDGEHNITVADEDDNQTVYAFIVDTTAVADDDLRFSSLIAENSITKDTTLTLKVYGKDVKQYQYKINNGSWSSTRAISSNTITATGLGASNYFSTTTNSTLPQFSSGGTTTDSYYKQNIQVKVMDSAGNWGVAKSFTYYIDSTAPAASVVKLEESNNTRNIFKVSSTSIDAKYMQYQIDGNTYSKPALLNSNKEINVTVDNIKTGVHTIYVKTLDEALNESSVASLNFSAGNATVPEIDISYIATAPNNLPNTGNVVYRSYPVAFDVNDTLSYYSWNFGDGTTASTKSYTKTYSIEGTYTVSFTGRYANGIEVLDSTTVTVQIPTGGSSYSSSSTASSGSNSSSGGGGGDTGGSGGSGGGSLIAYTLNGSQLTYSVNNYSVMQVSVVTIGDTEALQMTSGDATFNVSTSTPLASNGFLITPTATTQIYAIGGNNLSSYDMAKGSTYQGTLFVSAENDLTITKNSLTYTLKPNQTAVFSSDGTVKIVYGTPKSVGSTGSNYVGSAFSTSYIYNLFGMNLQDTFIPDISGITDYYYTLESEISDAISNALGFKYRIYQNSNGTTYGNDAGFAELALMPVGFIEVSDNAKNSMTKNSNPTLTVKTLDTKLMLVPSLIDINSFKNAMGVSSFNYTNNHIEYTKNNKVYSIKPYPLINDIAHDTSYVYTYNGKQQYLYPAVHDFDDMVSKLSVYLGTSNISEGFKDKIKIGNDYYFIDSELSQTTQSASVAQSGDSLYVKYSDGYVQKFTKAAK